MRFLTKFPAIALLWGVFMLVSFPLQASHIRAGDITAIRTGILEYCFRITLYTDNASSADSPRLDINFGNGNVGTIERCSKEDLGNGISINRYGFASNCSKCFTFQGPGIYTVTFVEQNRQAGIANMAASNETPFSLSITILVNPSLGANTSPVLTVAPIDIACVGQRFSHNPGAYDTDGDSLVFKMSVPMQSPTQNVSQYKSPESFGGTVEGGSAPATFTLDSRTGDLIWNAPPLKGTYNIAFVVEEWRNKVLIGRVTRDMQIIVEDCNNKRPRMLVEDACVVADNDNSTTSNILVREITATDGDVPGDKIKITSDSRQIVYDASIFDRVATFTNSPDYKTPPVTETFRWSLEAEHVQREPYIVVFKAEDNPAPRSNRKLVDIQSMLITVKGVPVRNVTATPNGKKMDLAWGDYKTLCPTFTNVEFDKMQYVVWRREGCGATIPCNQTPTQAGFATIGTVGFNTTTFTDNGPLRVGLSYSYVITVKYPEPRGGVSQASVEACAFIPIQTPIITKVSVNTTNTTANNGEIEINWLRPKPTETDFNVQFTPPYKYELYRAEGLSSNTFTLVNTQNDADGSKINFTFTDTGLDTKGKAYLYRVEWYTAPAQNRMLYSDSSSTARLTATSALNSVVLTWDYNTNWSNQNFIHEIYRGEEGQPKSAYVKIGEKLVGERKFVDDGSYMNICLDPLKTYGYYVKTKGSYSNPTQIPEPADLLRNDSQQAYASPIDKTPPAPPILAIDSVKCAKKPDCLTPIEVNVPQNQLSWKATTSGNTCQDFVATYRLYFKPAGKDNFELIPSPTFPQPYTTTSYLHTALPEIRPGVLSQAGCYYVTAVDQQNNESAPSNIVCQDNCLYFQMPNVFSPDTDGINDTFKACPTPQFVEKLDFSVYNRWGSLVYRANNTAIDVSWNGKNNQGQDLPAGVYYYEAKVTFVTIEDSKRVQIIKGWVTLMR